MLPQCQGKRRPDIHHPSAWVNHLAIQVVGHELCSPKGNFTNLQPISTVLPAGAFWAATYMVVGLWQKRTAVKVCGLGILRHD